jgi:Mg-chelatase subunit ChlD
MIMNKNEKEKTQVFNVIILDKSGSMGSIREAAVSGFNETLAGIRKAQETYADTQTHYVSLVAFCSCEMKEIYDKAPVTEARPLEMADYQPCCCTPLYDAMGFTLTKMQKYVQDVNDALVVVTIITDGLENASKEYTGAAVKSLVEQLKEKGWSFTYMGANQDAVEVAFTLSIRNARNFDYSASGATMAMAKDRSTRMNLFKRVHDFHEMNADTVMSEADMAQSYSAMANEAFDEEEGK